VAPRLGATARKPDLPTPQWKTKCPDFVDARGYNPEVSPATGSQNVF
jgi:hypothetical protein